MTNKALVLYSPYCILCIEIAVNILKKHGTGLTGLGLLFCFVLYICKTHDKLLYLLHGF